MSDQSVPQLDCVPERFHCQRALCDSGQPEEIRYGPKRENKVIVVERVRMPIESMRDNDLFFIDIDLVHVAAEEIHVPNHFANRIDDVGQIQIAGCDLVQHRREQEEILPIYDSNFESRVPTFLEFQSRIKPAKSAAENEDTRLICHAV